MYVEAVKQDEINGQKAKQRRSYAGEGIAKYQTLVKPDRAMVAAEHARSGRNYAIVAKKGNFNLTTFHSEIPSPHRARNNRAPRDRGSFRNLLPLQSGLNLRRAAARKMTKKSDRTATFPMFEGHNYIVPTFLNNIYFASSTYRPVV